jgi:hypothetical protein
VELDGATYAGFTLPFSITQLVWIEAILVGGAELYRNSELDPERRCYPGATLFHAKHTSPSGSFVVGCLGGAELYETPRWTQRGAATQVRHAALFFRCAVPHWSWVGHVWTVRVLP